MRNSNQGKLTITGIIVILLIIYGAFAAIKLITANITEGEIEKKVTDRLGRERRYALSESEAEDYIYEILSKQRDIVFGEAEEDTIAVTIDWEKKTLFYYFEYAIETDLIFTKKIKRVKVDKSMPSFK
ncbi:MAG: hypothetical protein ABFR36_01020 [Acidobacteriota bacterium]